MTKTIAMEKIKGRDSIIIGVFALLYTIAQFASSFATSVVAVGWPFLMVVAAFPCGIIFMYILAKVPKRWAIATTITICSLIYFLMGTFGIWSPLIGVFGGILADIIAGSGEYRKFSRNAIAFVICITFQWIGFMQPIVLATEQYISSALESGMALDYIQPIINYIKGPGFIVAFIATVVFGFIGAFVGKKVLRKHFERAGIV